MKLSSINYQISIALCLLLFSCAPESDLSRSEQIRADLLNPQSKRVLVASHRADWRGWPENSLPAIESAINMGVDIVELDLQCTADSQLIIMHDSKIDRTTTGKGRVGELTLDSIRTFRLKNGVNIKTRHEIPTLRDALLLCKGRVLVNLDKADRYFDLVVPILQETGTTRQIIMKGRKSADEVRALYGQYLDEVIYMPIVDMNDSASVETFSAHLASTPCAFELCWRDDNAYVRQASSLAEGKALLWVNCLWDTLCGGHEDDEAMRNPDAHYGYLIDSLGFRIIQTDRPEYLINYLQSKHKR
ncbi:MAG: glycerophosphodiester phosphodiesterase family protein [Paludibacteraceae bacterium]|nr:glycerophosphodiester phosphodiesterase family protein [Paludibacteraceae bacterium]